jgi:hypothetical protein
LAAHNLETLRRESVRSRNGLHKPFFSILLRRKSIEQILSDRIDDEGGPLIYAMESEEDQQRSFDSTCKKLYRFLSQSPR